MSGLDEGTTYYFAVKAFNACNQSSDFTNEVSRTIPTSVGNIPPTANAGTDQLHPETTSGIPTTITLNGSNATDSDGTISAYHWARVDSHSDIATILSSTTAVKPSFNAPGVASRTLLEFELTVTDDDGATATDHVQITITHVNRTPTANAGPDQTQPETTNGSPTTVTLSGTGSSDPDGSISRYTWTRTDTKTGFPIALQGADTATPSFAAPVVTTNTTFEFELIVTDINGVTGTDRVQVTITNVNQPPTANAGSDQNQPETTNGAPTVVNLSSSGSTDPDGTLSRYAWTRTDSKTEVPISLQNANTETPSFTAPAVTTNTSFEFQLTVTDNNDTTGTDRVQITIANVNQEPTANAGPDLIQPRSIYGSPTSITLNGNGSSDPDGSIASYAWIRTDPHTGVSITLQNADTASASFVAPAVTADKTFEFELTVTDANGATSTDRVRTTITYVNQAPTANAGPDQTQPETTDGNPTTITLTGKDSQDADGTISQYRWKRSDSLTDITTNIENPETDSPIFISPDVDSDTTLEFELTVTDNGGATARDTVRVTLTRTNQSPMADAGPNQTVNEQAMVRLSATNSSDPDGTITSWVWEQVVDPQDPVVPLSGASTKTASFAAPDVNADGVSLTFRLTVTDNDGTTHSDTTLVNVTFDNQPPIAQAGPDQTVAEGVSVTLSADNSTDPDNGPIATYLWEQLDGPSVPLTNPEASTTGFTSPDVGPSGATLTFKITVTDGGGLSDTDEALINVTFDNQPPTADAGADQTASEGDTVSLSAANSTDPDDGIASYMWTQTTGTPVTLSDSTVGNPTFTAPPVETAGIQLTFGVTVVDEGGLTSSDTVLINISNQNQPPVAEAGKRQSVREGDEVTLSADGSSDPDGTLASYLWVQKTGSAITLSDASSQSPSFTAPSVDHGGESLTFELKVIDNEGLSATAPVIVNVLHTNKPPVAKASSNVSAKEKTTVTLSGAESTDPDDGIETYRWEQIAGSTVTLADPSASITTFTAPDVTSTGETLTFRLSVTDPSGLSTTDEVSLAITYSNNPPIASAGADQQVNEGTSVTLSAVASHDPDNNLAGYLWEQTGGPSVTLSNKETAVATFTAPDVGSDGALLLFRVTITDSEGLTATATCAVETLFVNQTPAAHAGGDLTVQEGNTATLDGSASIDPDDGISSWTWSQTAGPNVTLTTPEEAIAHFVAPKSSPGGIELAFTLTVTDNGGLSHSDACTIRTTFVQTDPTDDTSNASIEILNSQMDHQDWLSIGWDAYRKNNNEARVASGDLNGDGNIELVIGLGPVENDSAMPGGLFQIVSHDYKHLAWGRIPWAEYNDFNGETWPACGDLDGDGVDEIVVGLGKGGEGKVAVFSYSRGHVTHQQWASVPWNEYNEAMGETRPACGNIDSDACMEIVVGLGSDTKNDITAGGRYAILDKPCEGDLATPFQLKAWGQMEWEEYNALNGSTWPSCGDIDGDGQDEILLGLGAGGGGKTEIVTHTSGAPVHLDWLTVDWNEYNSKRGETRPASSDINNDGTDEILIGLGPVYADEQLPKGLFPAMNADQSVYQWGQVGLVPYNTFNGESRLAPFMSNGESFIAIGLGRYTPEVDSPGPDTGEEVPQAGCFINTCQQNDATED